MTISFKAVPFAIMFCFLSVVTIDAQQSPCATVPEYRQMDFWIGHWRVETPSGQLAGRNHIEKILDGCVLLENWTGTGASRGKSLNFYDANTKMWHQKWVDNFGQPLDFAGRVIDDAIVYKGETMDGSGAKIYQEMTIKKISENEVRQIWRQSTDGKKTWTLAFEGIYLRETKSE